MRDLILVYYGRGKIVGKIASSSVAGRNDKQLYGHNYVSVICRLHAIRQSIDQLYNYSRVSIIHSGSPSLEKWP